MASTTNFSNTSTGDAPADPYKEVNLDTHIPSADKIQALDGFMNKCKFAMLTTRDAEGGALFSRCMALVATEKQGVDLLFFTNTESGKTDELAGDPHVNVAFLTPSGEWASVSGTAHVVTDRALVRKHYRTDLKAWLGDLGDGTHDGGEDDPRIGIIRVRAATATYSLASTGLLGRAVEVARGAVTGKPAETNNLREISASEIETWRISTT